MAANFRPQGVVGDVLVIAPGNEDDLLREAPEPRNGAAGAGGDGVVIKPNAVFLPDQLNPVLHSAKGLGHLPGGLVRNQALHRCQGGHIVFHVVHARQQNIRLRHDRLGPRRSGPV